MTKLNLRRPMYKSNRLEDLDPDMLSRVRTFLRKLDELHGITLAPFQTLTGPGVQAQLWAQSRSAGEVAAEVERYEAAGAPYLASLLRRARAACGPPEVVQGPGVCPTQFGWAVRFVRLNRNGEHVWMLQDGLCDIIVNQAVQSGLQASFIAGAKLPSGVKLSMQTLVPYTLAESDKILRP